MQPKGSVLRRKTERGVLLNYRIYLYLIYFLVGDFTSFPVATFPAVGTMLLTSRTSIEYLFFSLKQLQCAGALLIRPTKQDANQNHSVFGATPIWKVSFLTRPTGSGCN